MTAKTLDHTLRLIRLPQVLDRVGLKKPTLYRAIREGRFPAPCKLLDGRASAWSEEEVINWCHERLATREAE